MKVICHNKTPEGYYNKITDAWLKNDERLRDLYPLSLQDIPKVQDRYIHFDTDARNLLADTLLSQYKGIETSFAVKTSIEKLRQSNTYTVTTGQQIHIFLGPLFFIYKITSVIRQARRLQELYPENQYIPVFWMATEDHDIAEINEVTVFGKKHIWQTAQGGVAGNLPTEGLETLSDEWLEMAEKENLPPDVMDVMLIFKKAYTRFSNLADATRFIINELFGHHGLVIIDANTIKFKPAIRNLAMKDILTDSVYNVLQDSVSKLKYLGFGHQVNPRRTHFFSIIDGKRLRIDKVDGGFEFSPVFGHVSEHEIQEIINKSPENISPNALLRPVYQQLILPNVAYVCGPAELHYWHQLYGLFEKEEIAAPVLLLRDSYLALEGRVQDFLTSNSLEESTLWEGYEEVAQILEKKILGDNQISEEIVLLKNQSEKILQMFFSVKYKNIKELRDKYHQWLDELQKAHKFVLKDVKTQPAFEPVFNKLNKISQTHFNKKSPQERTISWVEFLLKYKINPIDILLENHNNHHIFGSIYV